MEPTPSPNPETSDPHKAEEDKYKPRRRLRSYLLPAGGWLERQRHEKPGLAPESSPDDEDDEAKEGEAEKKDKKTEAGEAKPRRLANLLRKLGVFKSLEPRPVPAENPSEPSAVPESVPAFFPETSPRESETAAQLKESVAEGQEAITEEEPELTPSDTSIAAEKLEPAESAAESTEEPEEEESENTLPLSAHRSKRPSSATPPPANLPPELLAARYANAPSPLSSTNGLAEQVSGTTMPPEKVIEAHYVERSGAAPALLAFAGAEFLSRGRDRNLRREGAKSQREIKDLAKANQKIVGEQKQTADSVRELQAAQQKIIREQAPAAEKLSEIVRRYPAEALGRQVLPPEKAPAKLPLPERRPQNQERIIQTAKAERADTNKFESTALPPELTPHALQELNLPHYEAVKPAAVLERVETAVEHNIPIEKLYERRHEVKDDPATTPAVAGFGTIVTPGTLPPPMPPSPFPATSPLPPSQPPSQQQSTPQPKSNKNIYRQAAIGGAGAAVVLVALILVMLLFS